MGDRYQWDTKCQKCGATIEVYYAPSCEMTTVKCWGCGTVFDIEQSFHLVESSGDKASAQEEGKVTPSGSEIISDADARRLLSDAGYFRTEDDIPAPSPAPLPKEVEEAMETIRLRLNDLHIMEGDDREYIPGDDAAFSVLKAALRPKVVSREWVGELVEVARWGDKDGGYARVKSRLCSELGIEVGD